MQNSLNRFISYLFFSNIYLGIIAVLLCIETNLISGISLNYSPFYIVVFLGTCLYYTMIYVRSVKAILPNERTLWYRRNLPYIRTTLYFIATGIFIVGIIIVIRNRHRFFLLSASQWLLLVLFPLLTAWYTFSPRIFHLKKIRELGMIKPFIVGLTWLGFVTVYPVIAWQIQKGMAGLPPMFPQFFLWLDNFLFISILAIIFDIKDYKNDTLFHLSTFPVVLGVKRTMQWVALPLLIVNVAVFTVFQFQQHFNIYQVILQAVPYVLLLMVIAWNRQPKSLLYYLAGIDGLMLLKALCGIASILFLNKH